MDKENLIIAETKNILSKFDNKYLTENGSLKKANIIDDLDNFDHSLMLELFKNELIYNNYVENIDGTNVFKVNQFIEMFEYKEYWEDSYTKYSNRIGLVADNKFISDSSDVVLDFPFKDCILKAGMTKEDEKETDENFLNSVIAKPEIDELLEPKVFNNVEKFNSDGKSLNDHSFDKDKDNLVIKGNNLIALYSIMPIYNNSIDVIYIDPPYNVPSSNNTFTYNNNFNQSSWLTFIQNRLEASKKLLNPDNGVLIIAIDENEVNQLGLIIDENFPGYEKHLITVIHNPRGVQGTNFSYTNEFLYFVFPKDKKLIGNRELSEDEIKLSNLRNWGGESSRGDGKNTFYPIIVDENDKIIGFGDVCDDNEHPKQTEYIDGKYYIYPIDKKGVERKWRYARNTIDSIKSMLHVKKSKDNIEIMIGKNFGQYRTVWQSSLYDSSVYGKRLLEKLVPNSGFSFPKSVYAVYDAIYAVVSDRKNAKILDFFAGSGTTAHAVQMLNNKDNGNRKFISIEQMDYAKSVDVKRLLAKDDDKRNDGLIYAELMKKDIGLVNEIINSNNDEQLEKVYEKIKSSDDSDYRVSFEEYEKLSSGLEFKEKKQLLVDMLDKNQLYYNYSNIEDENVKKLLRRDDYEFNKHFYD